VGTREYFHYLFRDRPPSFTKPACPVGRASEGSLVDLFIVIILPTASATCLPAGRDADATISQSSTPVGFLFLDRSKISTEPKSHV